MSRTVRTAALVAVSLLITPLSTVWPAASAPAPSNVLELRFYPQKALHSYEVEAKRKLSGALLQNLAIKNCSQQAVTVERVEFDVMDGENAVLTRRLFSGDLGQIAKRGAMLQQNGLLQLFAVQFRPDLLLGEGTVLAGGTELAAGQALLIYHQYFALNGAPDRLRVHVYAKSTAGKSVEASGELPIVAATAGAEGATVQYHFPLAGTWFVGSGQGLQDHHRWVVPEEFALDLARVGENGVTHRGDGSKRSDYFAYGTDVLAAADGTVVAAVDSLAESDDLIMRAGESQSDYEGRIRGIQMTLLSKDAALAGGNHVVIQHADGYCSYYAHLQPHSLRVHAGDSVKQGQPIARLGQSGLSTEPHLHFQVNDGPDPLRSAGVPVHFSNIVLPIALEDRAIQSGDFVQAR